MQGHEDRCLPPLPTIQHIRVHKAWLLPPPHVCCKQLLESTTPSHLPQPLQP